MARKTPRPEPDSARYLKTSLQDCPACGRRMWADYDNHRTLATLEGLARLVLQIRRCHHRGCPRYLKPYRPEAEGRLALPHHEFGLDVLALAGNLRYREHRSVPEIHRALQARGLRLAARSVSNLLARYDELRALAACDPKRLRGLLAEQGRVVLALDGLQPDVGHEVLWVLRDCLSGHVVLARSLLSATQDDLAALLTEAKEALGLPVAAVVSDGQQSIRRAAEKALPGVPHQLCHFHYLREAARPIYEADRHAKKELKKKVRGIREVERQAEAREGAEAELLQGYCAAVRGALTDDGRPPLGAPGLRLRGRLQLVADSLGRLPAEKGGSAGG